RTQRHVVAAQSGEGGLVEPGRMPELEGGLHALRERAEERRERVDVSLKERRQLEQERPELAAEARGDLHEARERLGAIDQLAAVRHAARRLQHEAKVLGALALPAL